MKDLYKVILPKIAWLEKIKNENKTEARKPRML